MGINGGSWFNHKKKVFCEGMFLSDRMKDIIRGAATSVVIAVKFVEI